MGNPPFRPLTEIEYELERGKLGMAIAIAKDFAQEHGRPIPLGAALQFLPVVVIERRKSYDIWACHWLGRWLGETPETTIEQAAEIAAALADLPGDPGEALEAIRRGWGL